MMTQQLQITLLKACTKLSSLKTHQKKQLPPAFLKAHLPLRILSFLGEPTMCTGDAAALGLRFVHRTSTRTTSSSTRASAPFEGLTRACALRPGRPRAGGRATFCELFFLHGNSFNYSIGKLPPIRNKTYVVRHRQIVIWMTMVI